jgi:formylglycine-generating enzyme required for sulfatase activity
MPSIAENWKEQFFERLVDICWRFEQAKLHSIYTALCAAALWPLAQAAHHGDLMTVGRALGSVTADVGVDLIAEQFLRWRDQTDAPSEVQVAAWIETQAATNADLQQALAAILEHLDAIQQAQIGLSEDNRQWFVHTLREELQTLGTFKRFEAQFTGSGAVAQGAGAVAAGQGGVAIGGSVYGNVYTGPSTRDPNEALRIYRQVLIESCRHVSLRGLDIGASDATSGQQRFDLSQVYVELLTTTQVPQDESTRPRRRQREPLPERHTRPLSALEAIAGHRRLVLLGDPGSGKSTCLTYLAFCLAAHPLEPNQRWLERLQHWPQEETDTVPVPIVLRDFAQWLPADAKKTEPNHLWRFIVERLEAQDLAFATEALHERLSKGSAMLLLDGLDEIPTPRQRVFLRDAVTAFARRYSRCRMVVTCRTLSYQELDWQLDDFETVTLAPFTAAQINRFIASWHAELARLGSIKSGSVEGATRHLQTTVRRPDLWRLASNPLLLTVITLVHTHKGRLPEARALLYKEAVEILLWRWDQVRVSGEEETPRLRQLLMQANRTEGELQSKLGRLAFEAHQQGGTTAAEGVADIGEGQLSRALVELHPDRSRDWAYQIIEVIKLRAGLLLERAPDVYTFPHRTFQEYLAGTHLATEPDFAPQAAQLAAQGAFWREVILLAVGHLTHVNRMTAGPLALIAELCPIQPAETDVAWRQVWLAGDVLLEMGRNRVRDSALGREVDERVLQRLVALLHSGRLTPVERVAAGDTLARLGDPRFREDAWYLPDDPLLGFVEMPARRFKMGSTKRDSLAFPNETPQHTVMLPRYYIARYPVTVAQFRAFVEARNYTPQDKDSLQGLPNHPVMWVSWYDALEYCKWLTECLQTWEDTPEPLKTLLRHQQWQIILPSEAEWEKAARGMDGHRYPWENDNPDPNRANYNETGIRTTSAVGGFPRGVSPYGVEEMSGNVWEWTRSLWGTDWQKPSFAYPYRPDDGREDLDASHDVLRVLRGGAFWNRSQGVRCAYRDRLAPQDVFNGVVYRVVVAVCS